MKLYHFLRSGNAYRPRLLAGLLGLPLDLHSVDLLSGENRQEWYLKINPRGQVPALDDGGFVIWDSIAILVYLARQYGGERWLPADAKGMAEIMQWLAWTENESQFGLARARAILKLGRAGNLEEAQALAHRGLEVLEGRLATHEWLALDRCTIADVACFPYAALAPEGDVSLERYPAVRGWIGRVTALPGFVGMPGIPG